MSELDHKIVIASGVPEGGIAIDLAVPEAACRKIAKRLDLRKLERMAVTGSVRRGPRPSIVIVQGEIDASVGQTCVVTLEPVCSELNVPFERYLTSEIAGDAEEIVVGVDDEEPEPFDGELIDFGEIAIEELSLAIDPYPRAPGADEVLSHLLPQTSEIEANGSPFAGLAAFKKRSG